MESTLLMIRISDKLYIENIKDMSINSNEYLSKIKCSSMQAKPKIFYH